MPQQTNVSIVDNGNGTVTITVGAFGYTRQMEWLFDRSYNDENQIRANARLAYQIGGKPHPASQEYLNAVNSGQKGTEGRKNTLYITSVELTDAYNQIFTVWFGPNRTTPQYGISLRMDLLEDETPDDENVLNNIVAFLRKGNFNSLTTGAINAINAQKFWR